MAEIGLFFGSDDGNTEKIAYRIQARFGNAYLDVHEISDVGAAEFEQYDYLILGVPTWDFGQIQSDWEAFWAELESIDFSGKTVALFGLGDQFGYGDFFLDAMGMLHDVVLAKGAIIVGHWPTAGYEFEASKAKIDGRPMFVGLAIDEDQQPELSTERLNIWCDNLVQEFALDLELNQIDD